MVQEAMQHPCDSEKRKHRHWADLTQRPSQLDKTSHTTERFPIHDDEFELKENVSQVLIRKKCLI